MNNIGERILNVAKDVGITQAMLAEKLGVSQSAVSLWGKGSVPRYEKIPQIAKVLGVTEEYLWVGVPINDHVIEVDTETDEEIGIVPPDMLLEQRERLQAEVEEQAETIKKQAQIVEEQSETIKNLNKYIATLEVKISLLEGGK
jgi:transcriptional regulator with XRE-family HTH domain